MIKSILLASLVGFAAAECPNACSGHGTCGTYDMCTCFRNWQAADCSQRTCPFDLAHVDTPKGDLDHSSSISNIATDVISSSTVYPSGTTEAYPKMKNIDNSETTNSGHYYMECSNKGICDRNTGECECFDGYDGYACQRASCPNSCSGHGTCETISELAFDNYQNVYSLWDKDKTMGCSCDPGYSGADCSARNCKVGVDPLYIDDTVARVTTTSIAISSSDASALSGTYALKFYDFYGEDYVTAPIVVEHTYSASCTRITDALKALPNNVISAVECTGGPLQTNKGFTATLKFTANPGYLKQLEIDSYLDGGRATLSVSSGTFTTNVYQTGTTGENVDYFATKCAGVTATVTAQGTWTDAHPGSLGYLSLGHSDQEKLLKACLGDSDGDLTNNVDVYNWDYGALSEIEWATNTGPPLASTAVNVIGSFPHAIKTVPVSYTSSTDSGEFHLVWYNSAAASGQQFRVANLATSVASHVYTTDGVVQQLGLDRVGHSDDKFTTDQNETRVVGYFAPFSNLIYTNIDASCESGSSELMSCVEKGDRLFVIDGCWGQGTTKYYFGGNDPSQSCASASDASITSGNLYTVNKIYTKPYTSATTEFDLASSTSTAEKEDRFVIEVDYNIPWDGSTIANPHMSAGITTKANAGIVFLFKFTPASTGNYEYVSACSGRGTCDGETGLCSCFKGYTGDDCSQQNALAAYSV